MSPSTHHVQALPDFWSLEDYDIVLIPSMTIQFYDTRGFTIIHEERHLVMLNLLKNTNSRIIFVISSALEADIIKYRLEIYKRAYNDPTADERLILLDAGDDSVRPLAEKILDNDKLIEEVRNNIRNPDKAIMLNYICNPLDEVLRDRLGLKYWFGSAPSSWGTKSGSRQIFKESGVPIADGTMEAIHSVEDLEEEILVLKQRTNSKRIIVKVDDGSGGYGNVVLDFSSLRQVTKDDVKRVLHSSVEILLPFRDFVDQVIECGVIIEQMIDTKTEAAVQTTPSVQLYISDLDTVQVLSSHEQVVDGCFYEGCRYPAMQDYLERITQFGKAAGEMMSRKGVRGFCGIDFLATQEEADGEWDIVALEINLRLCATTFSYFALLTVVDENLVKNKHYIHLDEITLAKSYDSVPQLVRELDQHGLGFNWQKGKGIIFTTLSTLRSEKREVCIICIGNSESEVDELCKKFNQEMAAPKKRHAKPAAAVEGEETLAKASLARTNEQGVVMI